MPRLLIVDDDANLCHTLGYAFRQEGFEVVTANDGDQAILSFRQTHPDLVILDVMLPGRDGFEVCRSLRRESDVPVIMLTARDTELDKVVGLEIGAEDYHAKPFSTRQLVARVGLVGDGAVGGVELEVRQGRSTLAPPLDLLGSLS